MLFSTQTLLTARTFGILPAVHMLAEAGFTALDLTFDGKVAEVLKEDYITFARQLRAYADARGVKFIQAHAPFGGGYDFYLGNTVPTFPAMFEVCRILGIGIVVIHPLQTGRYYGNEQKLFDMNVKFYTALAPLAKKNGVKIGLENMWQRHPVTRNIVDDVLAPPEELARMYDTLNDPEAFTVCLDLGHVALCGREPQDAIRTIGPDRLGTLHVHDVDYVNDLHTIMGGGKLNWDEICRALGEINYKGSFNLEADYFLAPLLPELYPDAVKYMARSAKCYSDKVDLYRVD